MQKADEFMPTYTFQASSHFRCHVSVYLQQILTSHCVRCTSHYAQIYNNASRLLARSREEGASDFSISPQNSLTRSMNATDEITQSCFARLPRANKRLRRVWMGHTRRRRLSQRILMEDTILITLNVSGMKQISQNMRHQFRDSQHKPRWQHHDDHHNRHD